MRGYVQVYTGDGKGKTTAAMGLALRAVSAGMKVYIANFMNKGDYGETAALKRLGGQVRAEQFGTGRVFTGKPDDADLAAAQQGLKSLTASRKVWRPARESNFRPVVRALALTQNRWKRKKCR